MICPFCRHDDSRVVDSRPAEDGTQIRRRRECPECGSRFSTQETALLNIIKRSGATEPFSREKVVAGVRKACQGRPVNDDDLALLAQRVEEALRMRGQAEFEAQEVGLAILAPLRELDEVAYLRYASVYRNFNSLEDFEGEIALLRALPSKQDMMQDLKQDVKSNSPITDTKSSSRAHSANTTISTNEKVNAVTSAPAQT